MLCSPINLYVDMALWFNPQIYNQLTTGYQNLSHNTPYDCGLTSVPCPSNITKSLTFSDSTFVYWFDLFIVNVVLTLLSLSGIIGNLINILIIASKNIANDSTNAIFLWLSISDLFCSLSCGGFVFVCFLCFLDESLALSAFNTSFPYLLDSIKRFSLLSLDFVMLISIQRVVAVVLPFEISSIFTAKKVRITIACFIVLFILTQIPTRVGYYPKWTFHPYFNKVVSLGYSYRISYKVINDYIGIYYYSRSAVDLTLIVIAIAITIVKLNQHSNQRFNLLSGGGKTSKTAKTVKTTTSKSSGQQEQEEETSGKKMSAQEVKVIKMSVAVCVITFVVYVFNMMNTALIQVYADNLYRTPILPATTNGGILLAAFGASFNFVLYLVMSSTYREAFCQMFGINKK